MRSREIGVTRQSHSCPGLAKGIALAGYSGVTRVTHVTGTDFRRCIVRNMRSLGIIPVLLAVAISGCEERANGLTGTSGGGGCAVLGTSSGSVSGAVSTTLNGCSLFTVTSGAGGTQTTIGISTGSAAALTHSVSLARNSARPGVASYSIGTGAGQFSGAFTFIVEGDTPDRLFTLTGGTVNITTSTASTLAGSLTAVTASEASAPANTITINANFSAKCTATSTTTC